jgi:hypothetical protein
MRELLPAYRSISHVRVGDGKNTSFRYEKWLTNTTLADAYPSLHYHFTNGDVSVNTALSNEWQSMIQPRLTPQAENELDQLRHLLRDVVLETSTDDRSCAFTKIDGKLAAGMIYKASIREEQKLPYFDFVWCNHAPPRVRFFAWNKIQCKVNLERKGLLPDALCELCKSQDEDADHIITGCTFAQSFWRRIGWKPNEVQRLWETRTPPRVPKEATPTFLLLCCWELWKHRHDVVFRGMTPSVDMLMATCKATAIDWQCRLPRSTDLSTLWRSISLM